ncbi:MAG: molybdopterin-dependent oxidoreductase [Oscillospiraceae bacterium]|nr:molybdopterin-dependent oxidoreductase [Oscillospiraceae bacterium]
MSTLEEKLHEKIPGEDTGIVTRNSFCDVCAPGPHCGVTCYVKEGKILKVEGTDGHPTNHGLLCPKGQANRQYVYRKDRVLTPLRRVGERGEGRFEPITWEEAWAEIVPRLNQVKETYGPSAAAFYSGYNKWYRPFLQRLCYSFGSVNYGTESSSCFTSTIMSWRLATGADFAAPDLAHAGIFLGWCYNAYYSAYLMPAGVEKARARGMKVIIVDPRITPAVEKQCDLHLRIKPGTDCALALGLARELIVNDWVDHAYIQENVHGYEAYRTYVMDFPPARVEELTGVPADQIRLAARMIHENMPLAINQSGAAMVHHTNGMQTHRAVMALSALMGTYDRPGGMIPAPLTYAHSMAGFTTLDHEFPFEKYPKDAPRPVGAVRFPLWDEVVGEMQGCDLARQITQGLPYPVKALWAHGMNFRMFNGDRELERAIKELDFFVDVDLFLTDSAKLADIVLPCCSSFERSEFKVFGGGFGQWTERVIEPLGQSRPDDEILCELARRLDLDDSLLRAGPEACVRYILRETPVDVDFLKANSQFPQKLEGVKVIPVGEHGFATPTGKFELWSTIIEKHRGLDPLPTWKDSVDAASPAEYPFRLVAGARLPTALHSRLHDVPWLRSMRPQPMADLNSADAARMGVRRGDLIELRTSAGAITVAANPTRRVKEGTVHMYHGYREADVNSIVPAGHNDPYSGFPGYRSVRCAVVKKEG